MSLFKTCGFRLFSKFTCFLLCEEKWRMETFQLRIRGGSKS